jgi:hypothetical protein
MRTLPVLPRASARWRLVVPGLALAAVAAAAIIAGCAANEPFDPSTVPNTKPTARLFVTPVAPDGELNPTSYYRRTFRWSGTDVDGWVREYYVSVRTQAGVPAPWDTTTGTDTTMTFTPDAQGRAEATIYLACRDDRGAVSDTVVQRIPLRNFPPAVNFQSDFDPRRNLQREFRDAGGNVTTNPAAAVDTTYFNWGPMSFRLFALDLDGAATMNDFYRYTFADGDDLETYDEDDPLADANLAWVRVPFNSSAEIKKFSIFAKDVLPGAVRTLRVSVRDEADSDAGFSYSWEVRPPSGPVLFIGEGQTPTTRAFYSGVLDARFGAGGWDQYQFWFGWPEDAAVLLETFRKFQVVFWSDGGSGSLNIKAASAIPGVLQQYLYPPADAPQGRVLFSSRGFLGQVNGLSNAFVQAVLGVSPTPSPATPLRLPSGRSALHQGDSALPDMTTAATLAVGGYGLSLLATGNNEVLYRMETCTDCYGDPRRPSPPYDPVVGFRLPSRATADLARFVGLSVQVESFNQAQASAVLQAILDTELGVAAQ